ncbi:TolB family protein [Flavobacterium lindanitolerans]|uniref:TolB family protein n=1 Tax=Flavobacterium lindanitolerans TaxID=428988 RepID=UPI0027B91F71|nr:hypothetical protein [Flavobacterium lindanitolerans]
MNKTTMLCSFLMSLSVYAQKIEDFERIEVDGFYTNPLFSPTGEYVLLTGEHLKGVYLLELKTNTVKPISDKQGSGYAYAWDKSGDSFYFKEKSDKEYFSNAKVINYNIRDNYSKKVENIDPNYLPSYRGASKKGDNQVVVYTNLANLKIEAKDLATSKQWVVTNDEGQFYNAMLSNDGKKVAVHNGADIYIYDIDGKTKGRKIGTGIATAWSDDDSYLIGFLDESENGHTVSNSELYLFDVEKGKTKKITNTEVIFEMFPTIHKDKVIFSDDKTGRLFIATLKMN